MKCKSVREMLAAYEAGDLYRTERAEVQAHLASCAACRAELAEISRVPAMLQKLEGDPWWADVRQGVREGLTVAERGAGRRSVRGGIKEMRFVWKPLVIALLVIGIIAGSTTFAITLTRDRAENQPGGGVLPVEQWPTFQQNMQRTGRSPYVGPDNPEIKWRYPGGDVRPGRGPTQALVIGNNCVMYIGMTSLNALDLGGNPGRDPLSRDLWELELREGPDALFMVTYPTVAPDGTIYVGGSYSITDKGAMVAVNPDGSERWRFVLGEDGSRFYVSPALGSDGTVYAASQDGSLYALTAEGELKWSFATEGRLVYAAPALDESGTVYIGSGDGYSDGYLGSGDGKVYAVDADGVQRWSFDTGAEVWGISIAADGTVYAALENGVLYALSPDGVELWRNTLVEDGATVIAPSWPIIGPDGTVYVASSENRLYAVAPDGALAWTFSASQPVKNRPNITVDAAGTIYMASADDNLYAISPEGVEKWRVRLPDRLPGYAILSSDGLIYIYAGRGGLGEQIYAIGEAGSSY